MTKGVRIRGVLLIVLGTGLAVFMSMLLAETYASMEPAPSSEMGGARFTGTPDQEFMILNLFTAIFVLGLGFALYGLFMAVTGRESRAARLVAAILLVLMMGGALFMADAPRLIGQLL